MAQVKNKQKYDFGRYDFLGVAKYITIASIFLTVVALILIFSKGFRYGVDFAGGIEMQVQFEKPVDAAQVRKFTDDMGFPNANVQSYGEANEFLIRVEAKDEGDDNKANQAMQSTINKMTEGLAKEFATEGAVIRRQDTVGPQVGAELRKNGVLAGFYCLLLILIYIGLRFDYRYAPGAVFCLFHDAIITLGIYCVFDWEVTTQTMAAVLTIMGYSLNDTVVIFDRIRENHGLYRGKTTYWISNLSINETLSRTILTYATTSLTVFSLYFFGDGVIKDFALAMIIGMFLGAYSTVYIATPLMLVMDYISRQRKQKRALA